MSKSRNREQLGGNGQNQVRDDGGSTMRGITEMVRRVQILDMF